jgi:hypothetical protein
VIQELQLQHYVCTLAQVHALVSLQQHIQLPRLPVFPIRYLVLPLVIGALAVAHAYFGSLWMYGVLSLGLRVSVVMCWIGLVGVVALVITSIWDQWHRATFGWNEQDGPI